MERRTYFKTILALLAGGASRAKAAETLPKGAIQLHLDMKVAPGKEQQMLKSFKEVFRPTAAQQPGYISVEMLKLRSAVQGTAPAAGNFRFVLTFASEEARQKWVATAAHQKVWPMIEGTMPDKNYTVLVYDIT
jgi:heme-degrading monooxygenase HmoA